MVAAFMLNWISRHISSTHIATVEAYRSRNCDAQIKENLTEPDHFNNCTFNSAVFNFGGRLKYNGLLLVALDDEVGSKVNCIASGVATCILVANSVLI